MFLDVCNRILGLFRFSRTNYGNEERDQSVLKMTGCIMFALYDFWIWGVLYCMFNEKLKVVLSYIKFTAFDYLD